MGYNAVLVVLTDRLHEIERDPEFGKKVAGAIREQSYPETHLRTHITGQTQVLSVQHADTLQVVAVGGNTGRVIGYGHYRQSDDDLIKGLERQRREKAREAKAVAALTHTDPARPG